MRPRAISDKDGYETVNLDLHDLKLNISSISKCISNFIDNIHARTEATRRTRTSHPKSLPIIIHHWKEHGEFHYMPWHLGFLCIAWGV